MSDFTDKIEDLLQGRTGRSDEREIIQLFQEATAEELNDALMNLDIAQLAHSVDNHLLGANNRDELLDLLSIDRVNELTTNAVVKLVNGLQPGRTDHAMERAVRNVLCSRNGAELTYIKNELNLARDNHDLEGLLFNDIDWQEFRDEILDHFAQSSSLEGRKEAKILSDIDDTAIARIHEKRYPKDAVIPGILAFFEALDVGPDDEPVSRGDLTFVTARPSDALGLMKSESRKTLTDAGLTDLSIMTGSWFDILTHDSMAAKKVENIGHYAKMFPEYDLVFLGDSGQGDITVAEKIRESYRDVVPAAFIHNVTDMGDDERTKLAEQGIWLVDTYIDAAAKALELGLISAKGAALVVEESVAALDELPWDSASQEKNARALIAQARERSGLAG